MERQQGRDTEGLKRLEEPWDEKDDWAAELAQAVLAEAWEEIEEQEPCEGKDPMKQAAALPLGTAKEKGIWFLKELAGKCRTLPLVGRALLWILLNASSESTKDMMTAPLLQALLVKPVLATAAHRERGKRNRALFPLVSGIKHPVHELALRSSFREFCGNEEVDPTGVEAWLSIAISGLNGVAGFSRAINFGKPSGPQERALASVRASVERMLSSPFELQRTPGEAVSELSSRFLSYTGEEVPKMQVIGLEQVKAALPPISHGGSIDAVELVSEGTKWFLNHPEEALLDSPAKPVKLQGKVHVHPEEQLALAKLLVERKICVWVDSEDVLTVGNEKVLNGLFAVGKGSFLNPGKEVQRLIMNLVPTNSVLRQIEGATGDLPAITQYLSLVLHGDEKAAFYQSDMSAAFYLFRIPAGWNRMLCFNLSFRGDVLDKDCNRTFNLACNVIPMGWGSAVSIMQEVAQRLTLIGRLPASHQVRRKVPLPQWIVEALDEGAKKGRAWFHVYLDNFCAMEKYAEEGGNEGLWLHQRLEKAWEATGVLSSEKKRVEGAQEVQELGAALRGDVGVLGPSTERLLKLLQTTFLVVGSGRLKRKWVQVLAGRWVHVLSFRRPGMVVLNHVWKYIAAPYTTQFQETQVRGELLGLCCLALLLHTNLRAVLCKETTASDASMTGGAVGASKGLTLEGEEFVHADRLAPRVPTIPVLVVSLFNGVGCAYRCYDLCGVVPLVGISYEVSAEANRVVSQRWPFVILEKDVRELTVDVIRSWRYRFPEVEAIHIWGGFPCVDLSRVRAFRKNLEGASSGLFWELVRIIREIRQVYGFRFDVRFVAENVSSMDREAEQEMSKALGCKPLLFDSADSMPIHRPRFCWTNATWVDLCDVTWEEKDNWVRIFLTHAYPRLDQWLTQGAEWPGFAEGVVLPTAMKAIKRSSPPPAPAGLEKSSWDTVMRWKADDHRYPPYQYADKFVVWVGERWRLIDASERELLHGLGFGHTQPCWNANQVKNNPQGYEDARKSLVGDSFNCLSFCFVAALLIRKWHVVESYEQLWKRAGMAPGLSLPLAVEVPLARRLSYGSTGHPKGFYTTKDLETCLLRRTNHTGSDVRISTGLVLNPKAYPRQAVNSVWWQWRKVFAHKWLRADHINNLELRAIVNSVEWRICHLKEISSRIFHLTDSYVCMAIVSKGRTSSAMLRPVLARLAASLLAFDLYLIVAHVASLDNPTDEDSREV